MQQSVDVSVTVGLGFEEELVGEKFEVGVVVDEGWNLLLGEDGDLALLEAEVAVFLEKLNRFLVCVL